MELQSNRGNIKEKSLQFLRLAIEKRGL